MSQNDTDIERRTKYVGFNRRNFLAASAVSASGLSTLGIPAIARAASSTAESAQETGVMDEIAREEALTFGENRYMGAPVAMTKAPNGAITDQELLSRLGDFNWIKPTIENPVEGIYVLGGYSLAPMALIETEDGLIAFDTGDTKHDGELNLQAIRTVTKKPIKAIIYGHSHTCYGAAVLAEGNEDLTIIGHPGLNDVVKSNAGGAPAFYPEVGPYLTARAVVQFNGYMPKEGPDAYVVPTNLGEMDTSAFIPVNRPVQDGEEMTVMGVKMQFFTKYGSDDKVHTTVWLPDRKILFTTLLWSAPPQLYSLRGDVFRDPRIWIDFCGLQAGRRRREDSRGNRAVSGWRELCARSIAARHPGRTGPRRPAPLRQIPEISRRGPHQFAILRGDFVILAGDLLSDRRLVR